jgi:glycosyltransferase involved in cell wall biosynthesis
MAQPDIAVLVSSFERPGHLRRVLQSIAAQRGVGGAFEVVVTDDGSRDQTPRLVRQFAASVSFPVRLTTHLHDGFHIARCRNEGVAASSAPYLLFLDGDCILPPDHLRIHLDRRRPGHAVAGYPIYLNRAVTEQIQEADVRSGQYQEHVTWTQRLQMRWRHLRAEFYSLIGDPRRPKLLGGNLGITRADYESVNGYDENFRGWGCEDDDLALRLRALGVRVASIAWWTNTYHLWHPKTPSAPHTWRAGTNVEYLRRPLRLTHCMTGLAKRRLQDLRIAVVGHRPRPVRLDQLLPLWCHLAVESHRLASEPVEMEIAFGGSGATFSDRCNCRVLIVTRGQVASRELLRSADLVFADHDLAGARHDRTYPLSSFDAVMQRQLGFHAPQKRRVASSAPPLSLMVAAMG